MLWILSIISSVLSCPFPVQYCLFSVLQGQFRRAKYRRGDQTPSTEKIYFKDVAGLKEAKVEIMEFVEYLKNADKFKVILP